MNKFWLLTIILIIIAGTYLSLFVNDLSFSQSVSKPLVTGLVIFFIALGLVLAVLSFPTLKNVSYKQRFIQAAWLAFSFAMIGRAVLYLFTSSIFYLDGAFYVLFTIIFAFLAGAAVKEIWPSLFKLSGRNETKDLNQNQHE